MKKLFQLLILFACCSALSLSAAAQEKNEQEFPKEVYSGTVINMNGRALSTSFTLSMTGLTTDEDALKYLSILASDGQDALLKSLNKNKLGYISATGHVGRTLLVARKVEIEGRYRIIAVFERWIRFGEARGGYRSLDYPFGIVEIFVDQKGKGEGTFIGAAQLKIEKNKKTEKLQLEIENFGTFPAKIMGVFQHKQKKK